MAHDVMCDVVLTEDDDDAVPPPRPRRAGRRSPVPSARSRRMAVVACVLVVLLVAAVVEVRARQGAAALATTPGVLRPVGPTLGELWRAPGGSFTAVTLHDDLVVATSGEPGAVALVATDSTSGARRWSVPLPEVVTRADLWCETTTAGTTSTTTTGATGTTATTTGASAYVVCRLVTAVLPARDRGRAVGPIASSRLVVLDARTGERVHEQELDSRNSSLAPFGAQVLLLEVLADGHGRVRAVDPPSGQVRWTYRTPDPLPGTGTRLGAEIPRMRVVDGVVALDGPAGWALAGDGRPVGAWEPLQPRAIWDLQQRVELTVLRDGYLGVARTVSGRRNRPASDTLTAPGSGGTREVAGPALDLDVDDGSGGDVVLVAPRSDGGIAALDRETGEERWHVDRAIPGGDALVLDGRLVTATGTDVMAIDLGTGEVLWTVDDIFPSAQRLLTDGRVVLVPTSDGERGSVLAALDIADGRLRWTAAAPDGVDEYRVESGRLFALLETEVVAFG